jgi:cell division protein FtsQ
MPVTAPADKRFRRAHLKPVRKRRGWLAWRWRVAAILILASASAYVAHRAVAIAVDLEMFQVKRITVQGNRRLSSGEVLALLEGLKGTSLLKVDLEEWRRGVLSSPWVADAFLRRTLPSAVDVTIVEREPLGIGRVNGSLFLVDDRGAVIDDYGPNYADLDLPIIDGLLSPAADAAADAARAMLARRLIEALRAQNLTGRVSQIDVADSRNAVVLLDGDPTLIRLGSERFVERLQSYFELAPALREQVPDIDYVDLRFDERVYVRPSGKTRRPAPAAAKPAPLTGGGTTQTG